MKNGTRKLKITNLDLACVLVVDGHECHTKKTGVVSAEFSFEDTSDTRYTVQQFYKGKLDVNIVSFMYARFALKRELQSKRIVIPKILEDKKFLVPGLPYFFVGIDGIAKQNLFSAKEPHLTRARKGNVYMTMEEAEIAAANNN